MLIGRPAAVGVLGVGRRSDQPDPNDVYGSFVRELAASPERVLARLRLGHEPDEYGWCGHPGHAHHWERHPCPTLLLAQLVEHNGGMELPPS